MIESARTVSVDLHVHVFPPRLFEAVWTHFEQASWPVHREHARQIAETLARHGIEMAAALSYAHKPGVAGPLNRFMEETGRQVPVFLPFATIHVDDDDLGECVDHAIRSDRLFGFKFQPLVQAFDVNDPRLDCVYERCLEADFPIMMHIGSGPMTSPFVGFHHFKRLMHRFPDLRICVPHMGSTEYDDFLRLMDDHPRMYMDTAMVNTHTDLFDNRWHGNAENLMRHADRICFGSDWPNVPYGYEESLRSMKRFGFPEEAAPGLMGLNALRFLGIPPSCTL